MKKLTILLILRKIVWNLEGSNLSTPPGGYYMADIATVPRSDIASYEWDNRRKDWRRPDIDRQKLKTLSERSTINGLLRIAYFITLLTASAIATVLVARINIWLAIPVLYIYYFFYGFWVAIAHELQHKVVLKKSADWLSEIFYFMVQVLIWNPPRHARISHKLHHRYTMVRGIDPETDWPEVITSPWVRKVFTKLILKIFVIWALVDLVLSAKRLAGFALGKKDPMMRDHCSEKDIRTIRIESIAILLVHLVIIALTIFFRRWELLAFITIAWQIGSAMEGLWHSTKHIARPFNVNDHRLNTRSIRVSPFIKTIFWGLDDHVDHHLFPIVPSRNLSELHEILKDNLPEPDNIFGCWTEMFAIAREKDNNPKNEFLSVSLEPNRLETRGSSPALAGSTLPGINKGR